MSSILSSLYSLGVMAHRGLYESKILKQISISHPVLSVGNLSMGGTGKTPVVIEFCQQALNRNLKPAVVSRSYGASQEKSVRATPGLPNVFGDEASLILEAAPAARVYVGKSKWQSALEVERTSPDVDLVIVDDGFQHHHLARNLDVVLVDSSLTFEEFQKSWRRENLSALKRAHVVLFTRWNLATPELKEFWPRKVQEVSGLTNEQIGMLSLLPRIENGVRIEDSSLVIGIANPKNILDLGQWSQTQVFEDHYAYTTQDIQRIEAESLEKGIQRIVTTSKDWIKIKELNPTFKKWSIIQLELSWVRKAKKLETFFDSLSI